MSGRRYMLTPRAARVVHRSRLRARMLEALGDQLRLLGDAECPCHGADAECRHYPSPGVLRRALAVVATEEAMHTPPPRTTDLEHLSAVLYRVLDRLISGPEPEWADALARAAWRECFPDPDEGAP